MAEDLECVELPLFAALSGGACWSADNLLAVGLEHTVAVLARPHLLCSAPRCADARVAHQCPTAPAFSPRGFTPPCAFHPPTPDGCSPPYSLSTGDACSAACYELSVDNSSSARAHRFDGQLRLAPPRALAWTPHGCVPASAGGCGLLVLSADGRLRAFAAPLLPQPDWRLVADLTSEAAAAAAAGAQATAAPADKARVA